MIDFEIWHQKWIFRTYIPKLTLHFHQSKKKSLDVLSKADYKTASVLLGHSNINTSLNLYFHPDKEQKKNN